jgi:carbon-monoxide dehydrogenase medium subunit
VAPTPLRAVSAESVLSGQKLSAELINQAAQRASEEISPITDVRASADYRKRMTVVVVRRALMATWDELRGNLTMGANE